MPSILLQKVYKLSHDGARARGRKETWSFYTEIRFVENRKARTTSNSHAKYFRRFMFAICDSTEISSNIYFFKAPRAEGTKCAVILFHTLGSEKWYKSKWNVEREWGPELDDEFDMVSVRSGRRYKRCMTLKNDDLKTISTRQCTTRILGFGHVTRHSDELTHIRLQIWNLREILGQIRVLFL